MDRREILDRIERTLAKGFDEIMRENRGELRRFMWDEARREARAWAAASKTWVYGHL